MRLIQAGCEEPKSGLEPLNSAPATSDNSCVAGVCLRLQSRLCRRYFFLRLPACCTVLRSRWCQSGVNSILVSAQHGRLRLL